MMNLKIDVNLNKSLLFEGKNIAFERNNQLLFRDIHFSLKNGDILQITGENGAGKTTLLRLIATLITPVDGHIYYNQMDVHRHKLSFHEKMLFIGHQNALHPELTIIENLNLYTGVDEVLLLDTLQRFELLDVKSRQIRTLSLGQQRRAALTKLLLIPKEIWLLDEPFTNLDTAGIKLMEELLLNHRNQGGISLIATHQNLSLTNIQSLRLK